MSDPHVPKHWIVAPWSQPTDGAPLGSTGAPDQTLYGDVESAKTRARQLAAQSPGTVYVVYLAVWYAFTDETPVNLLPVQGVAV